METRAFGWRQSINVESVVEDEGGDGGGDTTKNFKEGFLLALMFGVFVGFSSGPNTPYASGPSLKNTLRILVCDLEGPSGRARDFLRFRGVGSLFGALWESEQFS